MRWCYWLQVRGQKVLGLTEKEFKDDHRGGISRTGLLMQSQVKVLSR
jgi:hypothetical protein